MALYSIKERIFHMSPITSARQSERVSLLYLPRMISQDSSSSILASRHAVRSGGTTAERGGGTEIDTAAGRLVE